jgi:hypothetical protein
MIYKDENDGEMQVEHIRWNHQPTVIMTGDLNERNQKIL